MPSSNADASCGRGSKKAHSPRGGAQRQLVASAMIPASGVPRESGSERPSHRICLDGHDGPNYSVWDRRSVTKQKKQ
jgi:hypothetical protein